MLTLLALLRSTAHATPLPPEPADCFREVSTILSSDEMDGRGLGTPGLDRAADYIAKAMRAQGLRPGAKDYRWAFDARTGVALAAGNTLSDGASTHLLGTEWTPAGFSASGDIDAEVVFAGYGISAPDLGHDDYAGLDVKGKAVLALRYEPGENDETSIFDGKRATRHSDLRTKAIRAREAGAAALILVSPPSATDEPDKLPPLKLDGPSSDAGIPVIFVTRATADRWLAAQGTSVKQARDAIDARVAARAAGAATGAGAWPAGAAAIRIRASVRLTPTVARTSNVVGVLPGRGALKDELVVLGAHYDHLGHGGPGSLRPGVDAIHNGADDNASGVAGMLCAASDLARRPASGARRTVVFIAFSAEESGLGGSAAWVRDTAAGRVDQTVAMVNLDMVGRVRDGALNALGAASAPEWTELVRRAALAAPALRVNAGGDGYGPSDHTSFYAAGVPVLHLFSGAHPEYHTPDDDAATLNIDGGAEVVKFTAALVDELTKQGERLTYARASAPAPGGDARGYGAYFGSVPDYSAMEASSGGVRLSDTRPGSPAERAGLRKGDVIVRMAGTTVENLYDMTYVLREHRPGETIEVVVLRAGAEVRTLATLTTRTAEGATSAPAHGASALPSASPVSQPPVDASALQLPDEVHFDGLRRLTFGGDNAEAYWSPDGKRLILQITPKSGGCDQEYVYDLSAGTLTRVSSGKGRTTCGYFDYPNGDSLIYATTEAASESCPAKPDYSQGYVWPVYDTMEIVRQDASGRTTPWNPAPGYDAEATECHLDGRVVFTSTRNGDLDLYVAANDGSGLRQLTDTPGYDGGAFFTQDCSRIVWRASRPTGTALEDYRRLLAQGLVRPSSLDLFVMNTDGSDVRQLTFDGKGSFAPYPTPDGSGVLYSSNRGADAREFDIWYVPWTGGAPTRITFTPGFDGFPMFSPDGQWLVFSSNRANAPGGRDTDVYVTRWRP